MYVCLHLVSIICVGHNRIFVKVQLFYISHVEYTQIVYSKDMMGSWYCEQNNASTQEHLSLCSHQT